MQQFIILIPVVFILWSTAAPVGRPSKETSSNSTGTQSDCYFSEVRKSLLETEKRPEKSVVSTRCSGSSKSFDTLVKEYGKKTTQDESVLSLLLCRGAGLCDLNFEDTTVFNQWKDIHLCNHHEEELLSKWDDVHAGFRAKHMYRRKGPEGQVYACSVPNGVGESHLHRPHDHMNALTIAEAHAILKEKGILLHPGIPICADHKVFAEKLIAKPKSPPPKKQKIASSSSSQISTSESDSESDICSADPSYLPYDKRIPSKKRSFLDFAAALGIPRVCSTIPWDKMKATTKERKASSARRLILSMLELMIPDNTADFRQIVERKFVEIDSWTSGTTTDLNIIMEQIAAQYFAAEDRKNRILILSLVANSVSYLKIEKYIPSLSGYMYEEAKKQARTSRSTNVKTDAKLVKYDREAVESFIEFITSPIIMVGLPYGIRRVQHSDGSKEEILDSIRQQSATEIISMYKSICEDKNRPDLLMGTSTMYKLLNACAATKRESTTCVDYFVAAGMNSFDGLHRILDVWQERRLFDLEVIKYMRQQLFLAEQYLRADFRLHVKNESRVADHCANYALSDPSDPKLKSSCSSGSNKHSHDLLCERCEQINAILEKMETHAKEFVAEDEEDSGFADEDTLLRHKEELEFIQQAKKNIFEMKKHLLRAAVTNQERLNITKHLQDNEALVTLDFAQKFLPKWHREKQSDYFGKKGISYHISHVTARIGSTLVQHSFVHIYQGSVTQDSKLIVSTIAHFLKELKKVGVVKVHLRSDNAASYHCASTIGSLFSLMESSGVSIGSYTFSEAQNGKSSSDRDANRVKRRVKEFISKGGDVTTSLDFFNALKDNPPNGISVFHGTVSTTDDGGTDWKGISSLNYFTLENDGIRARKYENIGEGSLVKKTTFKPVQISVDFEEAGHLASKIDTDEKRKAEREAVQKGSKTEFWYHPKCSKTASCTHEPDEISSTIQEVVPSNVIGNLFSCPHPGCSSTFLKYWNLEKHMLRGQHNIAPERVTERDFALNLFTRKLEDVNSAVTCPIVEAAVKKMKGSKFAVKLQEGWALPEKKVRKPFGKDVVAFLIECFDKGAAVKRPMNPVVVEQMMRTVKKKDGSKRFESTQWLNFRQIAGFFSREADKRRHSSNIVSTTAAPMKRNRRRRAHRRLSTHRRRRNQPTVIKVEQEDYIEEEETHPDDGWLRFLKIEEFWTVSDEFYNSSVIHSNSIFLPINVN